MDELTTNDYMICIQEYANTISFEIGKKNVNEIFIKYKAHSINDLDSRYLSAVFDELHDIEAGLR